MAKYLLRKYSYISVVESGLSKIQRKDRERFKSRRYLKKKMKNMFKSHLDLVYSMESLNGANR